MTIILSKDLEAIVHDAVRDGLYAREDDVIRDALLRLRQSFRVEAEVPLPARERTEANPPRKPRTKEEFHRRLMAMGRISQLPDTDADFEDPDDQPIDIQGEPLSETVIRERR